MQRSTPAELVYLRLSNIFPIKVPPGFPNAAAAAAAAAAGIIPPVGPPFGLPGGLPGGLMSPMEFLANRLQVKFYILVRWRNEMILFFIQLLGEILFKQ